MEQRAQDEEALRREYLAKLQLRAMLKKMLTKEAFERLERVKMANPELYQKAVQAVTYLFQQRGTVIDEQTLINLLKKLRGERKEPKIRILRK